MCRLRRFWKAYKTNWGQVTLLRSNGVLAPLRMPSGGFDWEPTACSTSLLRRASHCSQKDSLRCYSSRDGWITADNHLAFQMICRVNELSA